MKKTTLRQAALRLAVVAIALLAPLGLRAQSPLTIGTGTSYSSTSDGLGSPMGRAYYYNSATQFIYTAEELASMGGPKAITSVAFYHNAYYFTDDVKIYLAHTTASTVDATTPATTGTLVYYGTSITVGGNSEGWQTFEFDNAFNYNGTDNLLVIVCRTKSNGYSGSQAWQYTEMSDNKFMVRHADNTSYADITNTSYSYTVSIKRPNIQIAYEDIPSCLKPTGLAATLTPGNGTIATLSWTENGTADKWEYECSTDGVNFTNPITDIVAEVQADVTGFTPETQYYARVRAICDEESEWSNIISFTPSDALLLTVNDGTTTNVYVPVYGYWADATQRAEFIIPSASLSEISGNNLTSMKFYPNYNFTSTGTFQVYLMEVDEETFSGTTFYTADDATTVYNGTISVSSTDGMTITFDEGFEYNGGNLLVGFYKESGGNYSNASGDAFYGVNAAGASIAMYSSNNAVQRNFLPKVTFAYESNAYPKPKNLTVDSYLQTTATLSWEAPNTEVEFYQYQYMPEGGSWPDEWTNVNGTTASLSGLVNNTHYFFQLKAVYSDGESDIVSTDFTTLPSCAVPQPTLGTVAAHEATIEWTDINSSSYNVRWQLSSAISEGFENGSLNDWTLVNSTSFSTRITGGAAHNSDYGFQFNYDEQNDASLISPVLTGTENGVSISFYYTEQTDQYGHEQFYVGYSTDETAEDPADFTYGDIVTASTSWQLYENSFPAGTKRIAIKYVYNDALNLYIDDIDIVVPNDEWSMANTENVGYTISGLTAETRYIAQVQSACGGSDVSAWSDAVAFTTGIACPAPTSLALDDEAEENLTYNQAILEWRENGDATHWQICLDGNMTNLIDVMGDEVSATGVPGEPGADVYNYHLSGLSQDADHTVRIRAYCGDLEQSQWSNEIAFHTPEQCPRPTSITVDDASITASSAEIIWEGTSSSYNLEYAKIDARLLYDDGEFATAIGGDSPANWVWGVMYPASMLQEGNILSVSVYEIANYYTSNYTVGIYTGETEPTTLLTSENVTPMGADGFHEIVLSNPVEVDLTQNYWIVLQVSGTYVLISCNSDEANNQWVYNGGSWAILGDLNSSLADYGWMIRASISDQTNPWTSVDGVVSPITIEPLDASSDYIVQVQSDCGTELGTSAWVTTSFTTLPLCMEPENISISDITAHEATFTWAAGDENQNSWHVYYSDVNSAPANDIELSLVNPVTEATYTASGLTAEHTYYVWVRANCGTDGYSTWVGPETFTTGIACPAPTGLAVSNITGHTADLSWTGTSESYNVNYRTAAYMGTPTFSEEFNTNSLPTDWSRYSGALTDNVLNGTTSITATSSGWVSNSYGLGQYNWKMNIYSTYKYWIVTPSITLGNNYMLNFDAAITAYNSNNAPTSSSAANANSRFVVLITTDNMATWSILREWNNTGSADVLNNISNTGNNFDIDLSAYAGETVKIAFYGGQAVSGPDCDLHIDNVTIGEAVGAGEWLNATTEHLTGLVAETKYEAKVQGNCGDEGMSQWTPSIFFTTDIACPAPTGFAVQSYGSESAVVTWNVGSAEAWKIDVKNMTTNEIVPQLVAMSQLDEVNAGVATYTVTGLTPETTYILTLYADCSGSDDGVSVGVAADEFTTVGACSVEVPSFTNVDYSSVTVSWNGESADGFTVKYRESEKIDGVEESFGTSLPTGWAMYTGLLSGNTANLSSNSYAWSFGSNNGVFDNHARTNIYSNYQRWLVMPGMTLPNGAALSFDLALTAYTGSDVPAPQTTGTDDKFIVLISNDDKATWTTLREWNNAGTGDAVYNDIANTTTGENVYIDLSSYAGQSVYIAFYGESTANNADNNLHIDNVTVGVTVPAGEWKEVTNITENTTTLTGLNTATKYDVSVVPMCKPILATEPVSFTTNSITKAIAANSWYAIASPVHNQNNDETLAGVKNLESSAYDLYSYKEVTGQWVKANLLTIGTGYIYRSATAATLSFIGVVNDGNNYSTYPLTASCADGNLKGFNLVGNPYPQAARAGRESYTLNTNGTWTPQDGEYNVPATQAVLVHVGTGITDFAFTEVSAKSSASSEAIVFTVSNDEFEDVAYAMFEDGEGLPKIGHLNSEAPMLSIPMEGRRYAIAKMAEETQSFDMTFRGQGEYNLTVANGIGSVSYLHLIDRVAGKDIDLLRQPVYSFSATGNDANRFMVKLSPTALEDALGNFAYWNGSEWVVEGNGTLQVFDVLGRQIFGHEVDTQYSILNSQFPGTGVYVLRLGEKSQKIVVK